jgi:hypothetical protein
MCTTAVVLEYHGSRLAVLTIVLTSSSTTCVCTHTLHTTAVRTPSNLK